MRVVHGGSIQRGVSLQTISYVPAVNVELGDIARAGADEKNEHMTRGTETWITATMSAESDIYYTETNTRG